MDIAKIMEFVLSRQEIEGPALQQQFSLTYGQVRQVIEELTRVGTLEYISGVSYKVVKQEKNTDPVQVYVPKNEDEKRFIEILGVCIKHGQASPSFIQRRCSVGYTLATRAVFWMEENGFVTAFPDRKLTLTAEEYRLKFGISDEASASSGNSIRQKFEIFRREAEEKRRSLLNDQMRALLRNDEDDDDDEDEDDDDDADDDEDEDDDEINEIFKKFLDDADKNDDDDEDDDEYDEDEENEKDDELPRLSKPHITGPDFELKPFLVECFIRGLYENEAGDKFVIGFGNEHGFELKFVNDGKQLRIGDKGGSVANTQAGKRRITNLLKSYPQVRLEGDELCITLENPAETLMGLLTLYAAADAVKRLK